MSGISAVIITHNEERNIRRCLESVQGVVDEIIVVDSGSTDRTKEVCEEFNAKFVFRQWDGYSGQKNFANSLANNSYILSLDADEALSDDLKSSILSVKQELSGIYGFHRLTNYCGNWVKHSGWYPDTKWRLFPARIAKWEGDYVHEELKFNENAAKHLLKGDLLHYSYNSLIDHRKRADKYSALTARKMYAKGKSAGFLKPYLSAFGRWVKMYIFQGGFLDGWAGRKIAKISAQSNVFKYKELRRLHQSAALADRVRVIALSRTDSIGDVMLTLPLAGIIKSEWPNTRVIFIGRSYTEAVIRQCVHVDSFINYDELMELAPHQRINSLKGENIDAFVHVFPRRDLAKLAKNAGIKMRIGTGRRLYNLFNCNYRTWFTRKGSDLHESELNTKLLKPLHLPTSLPKEELWKYSGFKASTVLPPSIDQLLSSDKTNVILHPKSKGSAVEWSVQQYATLINRLPEDSFEIFITGTQAERGLIGDDFPWSRKNVHDMTGKMDLSELITFISKADVLVAASTGPLHIAAMTGIRAIGLFTPQRPMHPGRWSPIGPKVMVLTASHHPEKNEALAISVDELASLIRLDQE